MHDAVKICMKYELLICTKIINTAVVLPFSVFLAVIFHHGTLSIYKI